MLFEWCKIVFDFLRVVDANLRRFDIDHLTAFLGDFRHFVLCGGGGVYPQK